jgi:hypothetical protein
MASERTHVESESTSSGWARIGLWLLPIYGALTLWATRTHQPDYAADFAAYAEYISRPTFLGEHILGSIGGTILALLGVTALVASLAAGPARRWALAGFAASIAGNGLMLTLFGVAAFASPAIGRAYLDGQPGIPALNDDIYATPLGLTGVTGALLYSVGAILVAIAIWRGATFPRWTAVAYALAAPLIGPVGLFIGEAQTLGSALLIAGTLWIAVAARRQTLVDDGGRTGQVPGRKNGEVVAVR